MSAKPFVSSASRWFRAIVSRWIGIDARNLVPFQRFKPRSGARPRLRHQWIDQSDHIVYGSLTIMTIGWSMPVSKPVNIADAKARLPELVQRAARREAILI